MSVFKIKMNSFVDIDFIVIRFGLQLYKAVEKNT